MGQVTLYLDEDTDKKLTRAATRAKLSKSRWVAQLIRERASAAWPEEFVRLAGAFPDFPRVEEIRAVHGKDVPRVPLK